MEEEPLDLSVVVGAVRHRWPLIALFVVLGLAAALVYTAESPPRPGARSLVLLPPSAITGGTGPSPYTQTQEIIAQSAPVLAAAGSVVSPPLSSARLASEVTVSAPSQDVMQFAVRASTLTEAEHLADALAASYIAYASGRASGTEQLIHTLQGQAGVLTRKVLFLQHEIDAVHARLAHEGARSAAGARDASLSGVLRTEQEQDSIELNNVNTQLVNADVTSAQAQSATQVLQRAQPIPTPRSRLPLAGTLGALAGLLGGVLLALLLGARDHHLRSRASIASAIGVTVVASMWARACRKPGEWQRLLANAGKLSPLETWNARRALQHLGLATSPPRATQLVVFAGDTAAAAAAIRVVHAASVVGAQAPTLVIGDHAGLSSLRAVATSLLRAATTNSAAVAIRDDHAQILATTRPVVCLEAVDVDRPVIPYSSATLVFVSSGFPTAVDLARLGLAASDSGAPLSGVVVVNPDRGDRTLGAVAATAVPRALSSPAFQRLTDRERARGTSGGD